MIQTKEQLLKYFSDLDVPTLQKLQKYSQLLVIPEEDLLTNANMAQMITKAHSIADAVFPEWTDRSKSDFGEFLLELFALFSEKDFWYINAFANEGILRKMRSYSNAVSLASTIGYYPQSCKGASSSFEVIFDKGDAITYRRGDLIVEVNGVKFSNDDDIRLDRSDTTTSMVLTLREGTQLAELIPFNGYNVYIGKTMVDIDSLRVIIDNIRYEQVKNFGDSTRGSNHFMVLPEENGSCSVFFGEDGFGNKPPLDKSIRIEYRRCKGVNGNIRRGDASVGSSLPARAVTEARMLSDATGGNDPESLASIKAKAPMSYQNRRAAINEESAEHLLNSFPFVHKSSVHFEGQEVVYNVIPTEDTFELNAKELQILADEFHPYLIVGYTGRYQANNYRSLLTKANYEAKSLVVDVVVSLGTNQDVTRSAVSQVLKDYTNPRVKASYGGGFKKQDLDIILRTQVRGVQAVSFLLDMGGNYVVMPDIELDKSEIFRTIKDSELTIRVNAI